MQWTSVASEGARALKYSTTPYETLPAVLAQLSTVQDAIVSLQSLDDLGLQDNTYAWQLEQNLWKHWHLLREHLAKLEGTAAT